MPLTPTLNDFIPLIPITAVDGPFTGCAGSWSARLWLPNQRGALLTHRADNPDGFDVRLITAAFPARPSAWGDHRPWRAAPCKHSTTWNSSHPPRYPCLPDGPHTLPATLETLLRLERLTPVTPADMAYDSGFSAGHEYARFIDPQGTTHDRARPTYRPPGITPDLHPAYNQGWEEGAAAAVPVNPQEFLTG